MTIRCFGCVCLSLVALTAVCGRTAVAQDTSRVVITVKVSDGGSVPLPGAQVTITDPRTTGTSFVGTTDSFGRIRYSASRGAEWYVLAIRKIGFLSTTRRARMGTTDTTLMVDLAPVPAAPPSLPQVLVRSSYRLDRDSGLWNGFATRCHDPLVACLKEQEIAARPSYDPVALLLRTHGGFVTEPGIHSGPPRMHAAGPGTCEPSIYVNGNPWTLGWHELVAAYGPLQFKGIEVYRSGQPRPLRYSGTPNCGVIVFWLK